MRRFGHNTEFIHNFIKLTCESFCSLLVEGNGQTTFLMILFSRKQKRLVYSANASFKRKEGTFCGYYSCFPFKPAASCGFVWGDVSFLQYCEILRIIPGETNAVCFIYSPSCYILALGDGTCVTSDSVESYLLLVVVTGL